jgi:hypothetical protein
MLAYKLKFNQTDSPRGLCRLGAAISFGLPAGAALTLLGSEGCLPVSGTLLGGIDS